MEQMFEGPYGKAEVIPIADPTDPRAAMTIVQWLLYAPPYHPLWNYYVLMVVQLKEHPNFPPPKIRIEGSTAELCVVSLHPDHEPYDVAMLQSYQAPDKSVPWLQPPGVSVQLNATEGEMLELAELSARAICDGHLNPEPPFSTEGNWKHWQSSLEQTLAHMRTGGHEHDG